MSADTATVIVEAARREAPSTAIAALPSRQRLAGLVRVETPEQAQRATDAWNDLRAADAAIAAKYKAIRKPVEDAVKAIKTEEAKDREPYQAAIVALGGAVLAWNEAEQARVRAENERRLAEAEAQARREQEEQAAAIRAAAQASQTARDRRALERQAAAVESAAPLPAVVRGAVAVPKLQGAHTKDYWSAEVHDEAQLKASVAAGSTPADALQANQRWLNDRAEALHERLDIPGVRAVCHKGLVKGRR